MRFDLPRWMRVPLWLKFVVAVALVQGMTVLLVFAWRHSGSADATLTLAGIGLGVGLFAALWLASMARGTHREALLRAQGDLARERERQKRLTERERNKAAESARREAQREVLKLKTRTNVKLGGAAAGMVGLGTLLLLTQFMSLGVLLLSSSGGALAGYLYRARQETRRLTASDPQPGIVDSISLPKPVTGVRLPFGPETPIATGEHQEHK